MTTPTALKSVNATCYNCSTRLFVLFVLSLFFACTASPLQPTKQGKPVCAQYLFLGHTYDWQHYKAGNRIDPRLESIKYDQYDQIWLGGDICTETTKSVSTLRYLDNIFNLSSSNTHWALGNHDVRNRNLHYISAITKRPSFYSTHFSGISLLVLNTNFNHPKAHPTHDECDQLNEQYALFRQVCDTISTASSSHLVILHHQQYLDPKYDNIDYTCFNLYQPGLPVSCEPSGTFHSLLYPKVVKVQQKGVQVVFISGDFGCLSKSFEYESPEGIFFLGSGINNSCLIDQSPKWVTDFGPDQLLLLTHCPLLRHLEWQFIDLDSLVISQQYTQQP